MKRIDKLEEILREHQGKENAISSQELSESLGGVDDLDSNPETRRLIRVLLKERKLPVIACSSGYFIAENQDEVNEYIVGLINREEKIKARREAVVAAVESEMPTQASLGVFC